MEPQNHPVVDFAHGPKPASRDPARLRQRLEIYRWLFWGAVFVIVVLIVSRYVSP
jgi:hypothetical protein